MSCIMSHNESFQGLYPVNELFIPNEIDETFFGKLAEIDFQLQASGDYTESQIKVITSRTACTVVLLY